MSVNDEISAERRSRSQRCGRAYKKAPQAHMPKLLSSGFVYHRNCEIIKTEARQLAGRMEFLPIAI